MCLSIAAPAFAASTDPAVATNAAGITKKLEVPFGTTIPTNLRYEFTIARVSEDGLPPTAAMPRLGVPLDANTGTASIAFDGTQRLVGTTGDVTTYVKETPSLLAGVTWPHAGVYEYQIVETANTYSPSLVSPKEELVYSRAVYTILVYVRDVSGVLTVTHVGALKTTDDNGTVIPPANQVKVDPTPGGTPGIPNDYSKMIFVNSYVKTNGGTDPQNPNHRTLSISKLVTGSFADKSKYFTFNITVTKPSLVPGTPATIYNAYVIDTTTNLVVTSSANYSGLIGAGGLIAFPSGVAQTVNLKHGQALVFTNTHVGASYTITEIGNAAYIPSARVTVAGVQGPVVSAAKGANLVLPTVTQGTLYVGETAANRADFTNDSGDINPTGISVDNMPYVLLISSAMAGLVGFVVLNARKQNSLEA
jgi:hypothetical protein